MQKTTLHSPLPTPHSLPHTLRSTLHTPHSTLWTFYYALPTLHSKLDTTHYTLGSTLHTLHQHPVIGTPHSTLPLSTFYSMHTTLHTLHFAPPKLRSTPPTVLLQSLLLTLHFTLYASYSTIAFYTLHFTLAHSTLYTSHTTHPRHCQQGEKHDCCNKFGSQKCFAWCAFGYLGWILFSSKSSC